MNATNAPACWSCGGTVEGMFCLSCGALQPPEPAHRHSFQSPSRTADRAPPPARQKSRSCGAPVFEPVR